MEKEDKPTKEDGGDGEKAPQRHILQLTTGLLSTYLVINNRFYEKERATAAKGRPRFNDGYDDEDGNYIVRKGEEIFERYVVAETLGKGSFGIVVKAQDIQKNEVVALKMIRNKPQFQNQAKVEVEILLKLNQMATEDHNIVKIRKIFTWKGHVCLAFELLSISLYDLLKHTKFIGVSLQTIRKFAIQLLSTLKFLASREVNVIHSDLKPENILLKVPKRVGIKVIDFGSSCYAHKPLFKSYIQSRFYRSPEVILGLPYTCGIDMWSLGCILVEMRTGAPLFDGKNEQEQLVRFQRLLGKLEGEWVVKSPKRAKFFTEGEDEPRLLPEGTPDGPTTSLEEVLQKSRKHPTKDTDEDYEQFIDLITKMLAYKPENRISPSAALDHPFIRSLVQSQ